VKALDIRASEMMAQTIIDPTDETSRTIALSYSVGAHGNNRQDESRDEKNEPKPENPKGEKAEDKAYPTGFYRGRLRSNRVGHLGSCLIRLRR
jgi:hypothetical protein